MSDPISPAGSPGQLPSVNPAALAMQVVAGQAVPQDSGGGAGSHVSAEKTKAFAEAVNMELAQKLDLSQKKAKPKGGMTPLSLDEAIKAMRDYLKNLPSDLQFLPDSESGITIFKVVNPVTHEVIRQYPPDEVVEMARRLREATRSEGAGFLLDEKM